MRLAEAKILFIITMFAAIQCFSKPCSAVEAKSGEAVAWIEAVHPKDALAGAKVVVLREGKAVSFPPPSYMAPLYSGDLVRIDDAKAYLELCTETGRLRVTAKMAGKNGYRLGGQPTTVLNNFAVWLGGLREAERVPIATYTRGGETGEGLYPVILDDPNVAFKLVSGGKTLHIRWKGGAPPFRVLLLKGDRVLGKADVPAGRVAALPAPNLVPGKYELVIKDKRGLTSGVDALRGNADVESLIVVVPDALPPVPRELAEVPLPDDVRQLLYADWLAHEEGGAWLLEALRIAATLAETYPPAQDWLVQWSGR